MTREEWKEWAMSLKPGDKVIVKNWNSIKIAVVEKVTASGRVNTNKGVFYQDSCWDHYKGYGKTNGNLVPATEELIAEAEKFKREREEEYKKERTINAAKVVAYKLRYGEIEMTYKMAVELLELVEKHKND